MGLCSKNYSTGFTSVLFYAVMVDRFRCISIMCPQALFLGLELRLWLGLIMLSGVPSKVLFTTMMSEQMPLVAVGEGLRGWGVAKTESNRSLLMTVNFANWRIIAWYCGVVNDWFIDRFGVSAQNKIALLFGGLLVSTILLVILARDMFIPDCWPILHEQLRSPNVLCWNCYERNL